MTGTAAPVSRVIAFRRPTNAAMSRALFLSRGGDHREGKAPRRGRGTFRTLVSRVRAAWRDRMAAYAQHRQSAGRMLARLTTHTPLDKSAAGKAGLPRCRAAAISSTLSPRGWPTMHGVSASLQASASTSTVRGHTRLRSTANRAQLYPRTAPLCMPSRGMGRAAGPLRAAQLQCANTVGKCHRAV